MGIGSRSLRRSSRTPVIRSSAPGTRWIRQPSFDSTPQSVPRAPEPSAVLTPREPEVLTLVSAGRSNGEIAAQLFISTKTASVHVSNILAKLGATGRTEAAAIARRRGLIEG